MNGQRFLLCRPQGGLNDMLCQIERCCRYAEKTRRIVVVDSDYAHSPFFREAFAQYFVSRQPRLILDARPLMARLQSLPIFPTFLSGRLQDYRAYANVPINAWCDSESDLPLSFDFRADYPHPVLLHHQGGGGGDSLFALLRMTLSPGMQQLLVERLRAIGQDWHGVHVRHSDYRTSYGPFLESLAGKPGLPIFLATDSAAVARDFHDRLGAGRVFSFATLPGDEAGPVHERALSGEAATVRNQDAVADLLMLALSRELSILKLQKNAYATQYSGYSRLAHALWSSKIVLRHLLAMPMLRFGLDL